MIIRDVLEWTANRDGALMEVVVFTMSNALKIQPDRPPRDLKERDVRSWMECIYQKLVEHLMLIDDGCLAVLILGIFDST